MAYESELEDIDDYEIGQPLKQSITDQQRSTLYHLIYNAILLPDEKNWYTSLIETDISYDQAEALKDELRLIQLDPLDRNGKIYASELNKGLKRKVDFDNT